jgi:hypothetical protein
VLLEERPMNISVIVMPLPTGGRFKARVGAPWNAAFEADDADAAFRMVMDALRPRVAAGAEFHRVDVPVYDRLFDMVGGLDPNSPAWAAWAAEVDSYRSEVAAKDAAVEVEHGA